MNCDLTLILTIIQILGRTAARLLYDNAIAQNPRIICQEKQIGLTINTQNPYFGRMFVNGMSADPYCIKRFNNVKQTTGELMIPIGACDMTAERVTEPRFGVEYSAMMVVSFHSDLLTESDRVFHVKCRYYQSDQSIGSFYEVGILPTVVLTNSYPMPVCKYTLHVGHLNGPPMQFARIGDPIFHSWECETDVYAIKIKNCYVDDGQYKKYQLIDQDGCARDNVILPDIEYARTMTKASVKTHVFKFADRPHVFFRCQLSLCFKKQPSCQRITPPNCKERWKRSAAVNSKNDSAAGELELSSPSLVVLDIGDEKKFESYIETQKTITCQFCITHYGFFALLICNIVTLMLATGTTYALCRRRLKKKQDNF